MRRAYRLTAVTVLVLLCAACPSSSDLDRMAKASNELAHDLVIANRVVGEFFTAGKMSLAQKDKLAKQLGEIGKRGDAFNNLLVELDKKYPQGTVPPQDLNFLKAEWRSFKALYDAVLADLMPLGAQKAVKELGKDVNTIDEVINK